MSLQQTLTTPATAGNTKRNALLIAGGLGLAGVGLAAGLMLRSPAPATPEPVVTSSAKAPAASRAKPAANAGTRAAEAAPLETQNAAVCAHCGVVEGVRAVQRKGEGSGVGAVAGGVVGAVVGHQMGGGTGKSAMTVLGALGGGVAGNEIEKRTKSTTEYEVRVRMDDGTLRSFTSATAPAPGAAVTVNDKGFHVVQRDSGNAPRVVRTAS
jgi:outer membrane lipoprotein SlyB